MSKIVEGNQTKKADYSTGSISVELQDANPLGIWRSVDSQWTNQS